MSPGQLTSGCDPPGRCQPSRIPGKTWLATGSLLTVWWRMPVSGAEIGAAPCLLALAVTRLPLCLQEEDGLVRSRLALLWCSLNPLFCEQTRLRVRAFCGKVFSLSLFFFFSLAIPQFGCYLRLAPSDCPWGIQALSLP